MRTFMKKSSLALLLAVLVLLTGIFVGTAVTASAEEVAEPEHEAALYKHNGDLVKAGTLEEALQAGYGHSSTSNYKIVLYKDVEIETAGLIVKPVAEFEGNGHTIYIDDSINVAASTFFFQITHSGTTIFKNVNFVGQDMDWDGTVETMKTFGTSNSYNGPIKVPAGARVEFQNCTITAFKTLCRASAIYYNQNTVAGDYNNDHGLWLKDTKIVGNYAVGANAGNQSAAVNAPASGSEIWGNVVHVSGNTVIKDNYDMSGNPSANVYVIKTTAMTGKESSVLMADEDFTGVVGVFVNQSVNNDPANKRRGAIFFAGQSYDADGKYIRKGVVFANAGTAADNKNWIQPQGATVNTFQHFVADVIEGDTSSPYGCFAISGGLNSNASKLIDTVTLTLKDAKGDVVFANEVEVQNGATTASFLPGVATWVDAEWGTPSTIHANGTDYEGMLTATDSVILASADGVNWSIVSATETEGALSVAIRNVSNRYIEVVGDYCIPASINFPYHADIEIDFNGYTITRATKDLILTAQGTSSGAAKQKVTLRNAIFDGTITDAEGNTSVPKDGLTFLRAISSWNPYTIENCTFKNFDVSENTAKDDVWSNRVAIFASNSAPTTLNNVKVIDCNGRYGSFYFFGGSATAPTKVYFAGETQICPDEVNTKNIIYSYAYTTFGLAGTFTGEVVLDTSSTTGVNAPVCVNGTDLTVAAEACSIADGAKLLGKISHARATSQYAFSNNGVLCWTVAGQPLPTDTLTPVTYDAVNNKLLPGMAWVYTDTEGKEQTATKTIAGVYQYDLKTFAPDAEAVIDGATLVYGDFATVVANAAGNSTIHVLKDVIGVKGVNITKPLTIDGHGHTLTWAISADPYAEADNAAYMFRTSASGIKLQNIVFHGGAAEKGVWDGPLAPVGARMWVPAAYTIVENCTFTGARIEYAEGRDDGAIVGYNGSPLDLINVTITDNIIKIANATAYNTAPHLFRQGGDAAVITISGKSVIDENYRIISTGAVYSDNLYVNSAKRVKLGELTEGSRIHTNWASTVSLVLGEDGKPLCDYTGKLFTDAASTQAAYSVAEGVITIDTSKAPYASQKKLHFDGTNLLQIDKASMSEVVNQQGGITGDNFALYYLPELFADYFRTDVVVKINGVEKDRIALSELAAPVAGTKGAGVYTIPVSVGMAELADQIVIELQDETGEAFASYNQTAKAYVLAILAGDYADTMKAAAASLLRYGAKVQTFFEHNLDNLAMTADDEAAWIAAGYLEEIGDGLKGGESVQAFGTGSVAGVELYGATLTMENQMSLRLYFTADSIEGLTFKVGGEAVEVMEGNGMYYIEASHIGTANLAAPVEFEIASGEETLTYTASPMSYVFAVFATENSQITQELKDACEALYYYFVAAGAYFNFNTDIGFTSALVVSLDPVNAYSIPYGITAA